MRRLQQILSDDSALGALLERRTRELALEKRVRHALPVALAAHVSVADMHTTELVLAASSGGAAALLRQHAPQLLALLQREGLEFTGIRVRVQARSAARPARKIVAKQIDGASAHMLRALAAALGDAPLSVALERLANQALPPPSGRRDEPLEGVEDQDSKQ